jgi:hypothetical protein
LFDDATATSITNISANGYTNLEMYLDELAGDPVVNASTAIQSSTPSREAPEIAGGAL